MQNIDLVESFCLLALRHFLYSLSLNLYPFWTMLCTCAERYSGHNTPVRLEEQVRYFENQHPPKAVLLGLTDRNSSRSRELG